MKRALGYVRKAVEDFNMIQEGDRIAIGVSGGKDSLTLLKALKLYQRFSPVSYHLEAITITMGLIILTLHRLKNSAGTGCAFYRSKHYDW